VQCIFACIKVTNDTCELERVISEQGFYVSTRLHRKSPDSGHWLTSQPEYVVIDDLTTTPGRAQSVIHPVFTEPSHNSVFHSLDQVTSVLTQLQVGL